MRTPALAAALLLAFAGIALGQSTARRTCHVEVAVPPDCVDVFADRLGARAGSVAIVRDRDGALPRARVVVTSGADYFVGVLDLELEPAVAIDTGLAGPRLSSIHRELRGDTCAEVLEGLALIAGLALEPPVSRPSVAPDAAMNEAARGDDTVPRDAGPDNGAEGEVAAVGFAAGAFLASDSLASDGTLTPGLFLELAPVDPRRWLLRLRLGASLPDRVTSASGSASLSWITGTVEPCPLAAGLSANLFLRPCGGVVLGVFTSEGSGASLTSAASRSRLWAAGRVGAWIEWLPGPLVLRLGGGAVAPITRERLVFIAPAGSSVGSEEVYRAPPLAVFGSFDVGVRFR